MSRILCHSAGTRWAPSWESEDHATTTSSFPVAGCGGETAVSFGQCTSPATFQRHQMSPAPHLLVVGPRESANVRCPLKTPL